MDSNNKINLINNSHIQYFKYSQNISSNYDFDEYLRNDQYFQNKLSTLFKSLMHSYSIISPFEFSVSKEEGFYNNRYLNNREIVIRALKNNRTSFENLTCALLLELGYSISHFENPVPIEDAIKIHNYVNYNRANDVDGGYNSSVSGSNNYKDFVSIQKTHLIRFIGILDHFFFFINKKYFNQISFSDYLINNIFFNEKPLFRSIIQFYQMYYKYLNYNLLFLTIINSEKLEWFLGISDIGELFYLLDLLFGTISISSKVNLIKMIHKTKPVTENQKIVIGCLILIFGFKSFKFKEFYNNNLPHDDNLFQDLKDYQDIKLKSINNNFNKNNSDGKSIKSNSIISKIFINNPDEASQEENNYISINQINQIFVNLEIIKNNNQVIAINNNKEIQLSNIILLKIFNYLINSNYSLRDKVSNKEDKKLFYGLISKSILNVALSSSNFYNLIKKALSFIEWDKYNINLIHNHYLVSSSNNNRCLIENYPKFQTYNSIIKTVSYKDENQIQEMCKSVNTLYIDTLVQILTDYENEFYGYSCAIGEGSKLNYGFLETCSASFSTFFKHQSFSNVKNLILKGRAIRRYDYRLNGHFFKFIEYFIVNSGSKLEHFEMNGKIMYDSSVVLYIVSLLLKNHKSTLSSITLRIKHKKRNWVRAIIKIIKKYYPNLKLEIYKNGIIQSNEIDINNNNNNINNNNNYINNNNINNISDDSSGLDIYDLVDESEDNSFGSDLDDYFESNDEGINYQDSFDDSYSNEDSNDSNDSDEYSSNSQDEIYDSDTEYYEDNSMHYNNNYNNNSRNNSNSIFISNYPQFKDDFGSYSDGEITQDFIHDDDFFSSDNQEKEEQDEIEMNNYRIIIK